MTEIPLNATEPLAGINKYIRSALLIWGRKMKRLITLGIMLLFLGMTISSSTGLYLDKQSIKPMSFGNILYVGGSGSGNYSKIQDAIDNASDGDTVFVFKGIYYEHLRIGKDINLFGEDI